MCEDFQRRLRRRHDGFGTLNSPAAALCLLLGVSAAVADVPFSYVLPQDAHVTLVVEDADGRRVRNLVSDAQGVGKRL